MRAPELRWVTGVCSTETFEARSKRVRTERSSAAVAARPASNTHKANASLAPVDLVKIHLTYTLDKEATGGLPEHQTKFATYISRYET